MSKIKYVEIEDLNNDQAKIIKERGWCMFTEQDEGGSYYNKGFNLVNRIGYIVLSQETEEDHFDSFIELNEIAEYDEEFSKEVYNILRPIRNKCYVYLVKDPAYYHSDQVWTNKGFEEAQRIAKLRFNKFQYYESENYDKMNSLIYRHNKKIKNETEQARQLLEQNGFNVLSQNFSASKTFGIRRN